jgi:hypothetical protein
MTAVIMKTVTVPSSEWQLRTTIDQHKKRPNGQKQDKNESLGLSFDSEWTERKFPTHFATPVFIEDRTKRLVVYSTGQDSPREGQKGVH